MNRFSVQGRAILITGASSGIGRHFARVLSGEGAKVALAARRVENLEALAAEISATGGTAVPIALDVTNAGSIKKAVEQAASALGGIDVLINNSGVAPADSALDTDEATWDRVMDTNLKGAWTMAQETARAMIHAGKGGSIINIASVLAIRAQKGTAPYGISKAGLVQMTRMLALEWARYNIRVNAIAPGYIKTDINKAFLETEAGQRMVKSIPQRRYGEPEDLDGALLLLASDASRYMTGTFIPVDGGHPLALPV